ncbi:MAG: EAL domain-containing protein [Oscillospiraceae bacterium]|nr:EAL domain-containing protein [Oscillospiraceae bacterium]
MKHKILIVEDSEYNRVILSEILSEKYAILEAENGVEALKILEENKEEISLIFLDVVMPVMDGYTFLDIIKKDSYFSNIPVIVMTQNDSEDDEITALSRGATDFVPKPYRPQVILHRAASLINLRENASIVNQFKYDRLTGLYTKEYFYRIVRDKLDKNPDSQYTILCCNLENFKLYNDTYGREAGDKLLIEEARILVSKVGEDTVCCRYNADRFLCLVDKEKERVRREHFVKARKINHSDLTENVSVKLGIFEITDRTIPVEQMCDRAIWMVDTIKGIYSQYVAVYNDEFRNKLIREQAITDSMENALAEKQFMVYFQPKNNLADDSMVGAEALVRWIHPVWGFVSPIEFIPLFEKNGFIRRLDEYVWDFVCSKLREWIDKGYKVVPVSVNVSRADIYQPFLVDYFCDLIEKYNIDPSMLHLEITESAYKENPEQIIKTVEELRQYGFIIEMDDFGSGYSSLNMLGKMSLDILKLDMQFIRNEMAKPVECSILIDIVNMAHRLHLGVVAEGVETEEQKERLKSVDCDYAQGYYYSRPVPVNEYEHMLIINGYTV